VRRKAAALLAAAALAVVGFALAQEVFTVSVAGPSGTTTATDATVTVSANGTAFFRCGLNGTTLPCDRVGTTAVATATGLALGTQTFVVSALSFHSKTSTTGALTWTVVAAASTTTSSTTSASTATSTTTQTTTTTTTTPFSTVGRHHGEGTSPLWYLLAGGAGGAALALGAVVVRARRTRRGFGVEIEASTEEPKGPCRGRARRRHVKATLLPAQRTIAHLALTPRGGETATIAGELVDALNDAVRRYRRRREADEVRLVALPIAAGLRREIDERLEREGAEDVAVAAHLEGGKLEVVQRLYGCVQGEWKPVGPEVKVEVADERDEPVATTTRRASAEAEQRLVEYLAAFIGRVDVRERTPVEPPRSALRAL
jgi:uncharacterized OsmC-like protein